MALTALRMTRTRLRLEAQTNVEAAPVTRVPIEVKPQTENTSSRSALACSSRSSARPHARCVGASSIRGTNARVERVVELSTRTYGCGGARAALTVDRSLSSFPVRIAEVTTER